MPQIADGEGSVMRLRASTPRSTRKGDQQHEMAQRMSAGPVRGGRRSGRVGGGEQRAASAQTPNPNQFVGKLGDSDVFIGVVRSGPKVFALLCDGTANGVKRWTWYRGIATGDVVELRDGSSNTLFLRFADGIVEGRALLADGPLPEFRAELAVGDAGLFRGETTLGDR